MPGGYDDDIAAIQNISAVPTILDVVCRTTGMGFAAVARVTEDRWIACQVLDNIHFGLAAGGELKVETTLCHEVRQHRNVVVIDNVDDDPIYANHHTPALYGLQSYISVPIILPDGRFFGTLCAIDPNPAKLNNPQILGTFKLFAELIAYHLDTAEKLAETEARMLDAEKSAELREQFIAVLGHDLRNPLSAIDAGAGMLLREGWTEKSPRILRLMKASVARMAGLVDNVVDLARARMGGGIVLQLEDSRSVEATLAQVVDEMRAIYPERAIETRFRIVDTITGDHVRIAQLFSNLLANAVTHGAEDEPITVDAVSADGQFRLSVSNGGGPIPDDMMANLFKPFHRGHVRPNLQGLGLGLYIARQIAEAHSGTLSVDSDGSRTSFTFAMPTRR